ncbi:MAG TPA: DMT family transporter [Polyangia bacterium]|nr:DMT family transporter [Polyangia bacterium]
MTQRARTFRTFALTGAALIGFAANSLLCRAALRPGLIDAASFTALRLGSGALALALLERAGSGSRRARAEAGSFWSGAALFAYAAAFSFAYLRIGAGVGALILFGAVQATMIGWGLLSGERPRALEWMGVLVALSGLALLPAPGARAADPLGAALMAGAGIAWGIYSVRGRGVARPLAATAANFARSLPWAALLWLGFAPRAHASWGGAALAVASGALASGVGYSVWYAALRGLSATRAAVVQLATPVLAAVGAVTLLGETLGARLLVCGAAILGGVALALAGRGRPARLSAAADAQAERRL